MANAIGRQAARSPASLVEQIRRSSGLSQAELARRAGLPRSVLNVYLRGHREPGTEALLRIAAAGGIDLRLARRRPLVDADQAAERLVQVLELAEALPYRPRERLGYPRLSDRVQATAA
ncbi:MAG TPA: helix-turn-helix transcriptional regulator [Solirubrobacterales bacterium]